MVKSPPATRKNAFADEPAPRPQERNLAGIMHLCTIPWPIIAPIVAWVVHRRSSRFVTAHALQALFETILLNVLLLIATIASLTYTIVTLWGHYQSGWEDFSIWPFLARFAVGFIALGLLWLITTIISIGQAVRAFRGQWPKQGKFLRGMSRGASQSP